MSKTKILAEGNVSMAVKSSGGLTVDPENPGFVKVELYKPVQPVGYWRLSDHPMSYCIAMYTKPTDDQIRATESTFGWKWEDIK